MTNDKIDIQEKLRRLRMDYAESLPDKISEIKTVWQLFHSDTEDEESGRLLARLSHTLAGSGSSFGFPEVTRISRKIEHFVYDLLESGKTLDDKQKLTIDELISELMLQAQCGPDEQTHTEFSYQPDLQKSITDNRLVYIVEADESVHDEIEAKLRQYGYSTESFRHREDVIDAVKEVVPAAIMIDIHIMDGDGANFVSELESQTGHLIPSIVMSNFADTPSRLRAVQAGANAFLSKPFDYSSLIDKLDLITSTESSEPYRIMIVDDSTSSAEFYAYSLQQAGMQTTIVTDPMDVMKMINEFNPELILMDLYMPQCSGTDLAQVIRQQESYISTPIVFLSSETNLERQLSALTHGVDDFLTKPIRAAHLVSTVSSRVTRHRQLRRLMVRDSLTGLYNHTNITEILERELSRSIRSNTPLSYVMLDLDFFKRVNDTYGHNAGDNVLRQLSRLLKQRLRNSDFIGRYGGEEFAVIMPDTDAETAERVMNDLRHTFSQIKNNIRDDEFSCTFSAGIAAYPGYTNPIALIDSADKALYEAKQTGRNRVYVAKND